MRQRNELTSILVLMSLSLITTASHANDAEQLHNKNCQQCHDSSMYTRAKSIIQSYPELQARVDFCENAARAHWSDTQTQSVVDYLNQEFYKYDRP